MTTLRLNRYQWLEHEGVYLHGFIWLNDQKLNVHSLQQIIASFSSVIEFNDFIAQLNGQFIIVVQNENYCWLAVDRIRSSPIFFKNNGTISDDFFQLKDTSDIIDEYQALSFVAFGHTQNHSSLYKSIFDLQAGHSAEYINGDWKTYCYHSFLKKKRLPSSFQTHQNQLLEKLNIVSSQLIKNIDDRPVIIPLSGGKDSRLIATWLKDHSVKNVKCFTYGKKYNNFEWKVSKEVAKRLGFEWKMIDYDDPRLIEQFDKTHFLDYAKYVGQGSSMPFMQEYFALNEMIKNNQIDDKSVFVPGFSMDGLAGGMQSVALEKSQDLQSITRVILENNAKGVALSSKEKAQISKGLSIEIQNQIDNGYLANSIVENWDFKNRQARFTVNSCQLYKYHGFDYLIPFWDNTLIDFFYKLSFEETKGCSLYHETLRTKIFKDSLSFETDSKSLVRKNSYWKGLLKSNTPSRILEIKTRKGDYLNYKEFTKPLVSELLSKGIQPHSPRNSYNNLISEWYLFKLRNEKV
jgi:asparagine synthase (glutamine-hydrolysing)